MKKIRLLVAVVMTAILLILVVLMTRLAFSLMGHLTARPEEPAPVYISQPAPEEGLPPEENDPTLWTQDMARDISLSDMAYEASEPADDPEEDLFPQEELISVPVLETSQQLAEKQVSGEEG